MAPRTVVVSGNGTNSVTFTIPPLVEFTPESVVASVDAGGAGDTTAELQVADQSGVVIAAKRQSEVVPAGDTGLATWALRLTDEGGGGGGGDYIFVDEVGPSFGGTYSFTGIPQDARDLVVFIENGAGAGQLVAQFNGDGAAHYYTVAETITDTGGAVTQVLASGTANSILLGSPGPNDNLSSYVLTLPYYQTPFAATLVSRKLLCEAVEIHTPVPPALPSRRLRHVAGFWQPTGSGVPRITRIDILNSAAAVGKASLYKIV